MGKSAPSRIIAWAKPLRILPSVVLSHLMSLNLTSLPYPCFPNPNPKAVAAAPADGKSSTKVCYDQKPHRKIRRNGS